MSSDPTLLVAPPSTSPRAAHSRNNGAATKAPGLPEQSNRAAAGSNSYDGPNYGDCRHCQFSGLLRPDGTVEQHADRRIRESGTLRRICQGSGESPVTRLEADNSRKGA